MSETTRDEDEICAQAAHWLVRAESAQMSAEEHRQFRQWLCADPRHGEEFSDCAAFWGAMDELPPGMRERLKASLHNESQPLHARWGWKIDWSRLATAAIVLAAVGAGVWLITRDSSTPQESFVTRSGELRTVTLQDGSIVELSGDTRLQWTGSQGERRVALLAGEAYFDVTPDKNSPFRVNAGNSEIEVLGTVFNVRHHLYGKISVTVFEGSVAVTQKEQADRSSWQRKLYPGRQLIFGADGIVQESRIIAPEEAAKLRARLTGNRSSTIVLDHQAKARAEGE